MGGGGGGEVWEGELERGESKTEGRERVKDKGGGRWGKGIATQAGQPVLISKLILYQCIFSSTMYASLYVPLL